MKFKAKEFTLKDGRKCILRPAAPEDAAEMIRYMKETSAETEYLLRYPDEIQYTLDSEKEILARVLDDPSSVMMAASVDGRIAGNCSISGIGTKRKVRHRCSVAIALYRKFWGAGIGSAMLSYLGELAKQIGYDQMDLEVEMDVLRNMFAQDGLLKEEWQKEKGI